MSLWKLTEITVYAHIKNGNSESTETNILMKNEIAGQVTGTKEHSYISFTSYIRLHIEDEVIKWQ